MEASEGTDHDNTSAETLSGEVSNADFAGDLSDSFALVGSLSELRNEGVSRMGDDGANNTSEVTGSEGDTELSGLAVSLLRASEDVGVEQLDDLFEEEEFGHSVRNL